MKYYITGATGHLGLNLVKALNKPGNQIKALVMPNDSNVKYLPKEVEVIYGNTTNKDDVLKFIDAADAIVMHLAGIVSIASKYNELVYDVNVNGTKNIVDACLLRHVSKLVYVSSVHAIAPLSNNEVMSETTVFDQAKVIGLYAKTKCEATAYVLKSASKLNVTVVHPSGIIGPNDYGHGHLTQLIVDFCNGSLTAGVKGGYDFVDVRDVVAGIIKASLVKKSGECYILSNQYVSVPHLLKALAQVTGHKEIKTYLPLWLAKMTAPLAEFYYKIKHETPLYTSYSLYTLESNANFSHAKATKELDYQPRSLVATLKDTVTFLESIGRIKHV